MSNAMTLAMGAGALPRAPIPVHQAALQRRPILHSSAFVGSVQAFNCPSHTPNRHVPPSTSPRASSSAPVADQQELTEIVLDDLPEGLRGKVALRTVTGGLLTDTANLLQMNCSREELKVVRLLLCLGLAKNDVVRSVAANPSLLKLSILDILQSVKTFVDLGCTVGEATTAILRNPELVAVSPARFQSTVDQLVAVGVDLTRMHRVILRFPGIFELPVEDIQPSIAKLQYLVGSGKDVMRMVERQPRLLSLGENDIASTMEILTANVSTESLPQIIEAKPQVLLMSPEALLGRFEYLSTVFNRRRLSSVFRSAPGLLTVDAGRLKRQHARLVNYLDETAARKVINNFPQALTLNWERVLLPKFQYLTELGLDRFEVLNFPAYLGYSLNSRIRPRCVSLLKAGYEIKSHDEVMRVAGERRSQKVGRSHYELLQEYGDHCVAIQHIVGLTDVEFRNQFGVDVAL